MTGSITVTDLGKAYKTYPSRFARLKEWMLPFIKPTHRLKWALRNINFQVTPGEAVGIIGINGAGKSTLLKMLTGTTQPTEGTIQTEGSVAALLELGIGFHPEFTGRQNAVMACQLLGMSMEDSRRLMPQIESFAEIGEYIDHPVRVYSSGMQMRLAFSAATAVRPDILIVDEALSVGDAYFQHKSFERIRDFRRQGTTLLIVSHDKAAIQSICDCAILLHDGGIELKGKPNIVLDYYNALLSAHQNLEIGQEVCEDGKIQTLSGSREIRIENIQFYNSDGEPIKIINVGDSVELRIFVKAYKDVSNVVLGYLIKDRLGQAIFGITSIDSGISTTRLLSGETIVYKIGCVMNLGAGSYSISTALTDGLNHLNKNYEWKDMALVFQVINAQQPSFIGSTWLNPTMELQRI